MRFVAAGLVLSTLGLAAVLPSCFSPDEPLCEFSCAQPPNLCPTGYECRSDHYCHRTGSPASTLCPNFPGAEAGVADAHPDANRNDGETDGMPDAAVDGMIDGPPPDGPPPDAPPPDAQEPDAMDDAV